jgi:hypothetical protein
VGKKVVNDGDEGNRHPFVEYAAPPYASPSDLLTSAIEGEELEAMPGRELKATLGRPPSMHCRRTSPG